MMMVAVAIEAMEKQEDILSESLRHYQLLKEKRKEKIGNQILE